MAFCIQCGEALGLEASTCPSCKRPVGASSIGAAKERRGDGRQRTILAAMAGLVVLLVVAAGVVFALRRGVSRAQLEKVAQTTASSVVQVQGAPGLVLRALDRQLLVLASASSVKPGQEVTVAAGGQQARGVCLLAAPQPELAELALVLVPDGSALPVREVRVAPKPQLDQFVVALASDGTAAGAGRVLSFEDGPGAGSLVHDAPLTPAARTKGLWDVNGALLALPTFKQEQGEGLAIAASALLERLLVHDVPLLADAEWTEHALPLPKGGLVAVALRAGVAERLEARLGQGGRAAHAKAVWPGLSTVQLRPEAAAALQLGGVSGGAGAGARATVVTLAKL